MGGGSRAPQESQEQIQLEALRKRKDKEMQNLLLDQIRNMKGAGGSTSGGDLG